MPLVHVWCNTNLEGGKKELFLSEATARVASMLGKGERWVMVRVSDGGSMTFGGSDAPCCYAEFKSLGLPENRTEEFSAALCDLINTHLGIPGERVYIEFADPPRSMFGFDGATFG